MKVLIAILLCLSVSTLCHAEFLELELGPVPTHAPFAFDFGHPLPDITQVEVTFEGAGGHQCIFFNSPGTNESVDYPFDVSIDLEAGLATFYAPMDQAYTTTQMLLLPDDATWESLADGAGMITFSPYHTGPETNNFSITACGFDPCTVTAATIRVTYGNEVPVEDSSWSGFKALFR